MNTKKSSSQLFFFCLLLFTSFLFRNIFFIIIAFRNRFEERGELSLNNVFLFCFNRDGRCVPRGSFHP